MPSYRHLLPVHTKYLGSPIRDTEVPKNPAQIHGLLKEIRAGLEANRCIYLHCRAGIERTALIVGCYL